METLYQLLQLFLYLNNILSYYYLNLIDDVSPDILDVRKPKHQDDENWQNYKVRVI